MVLYIMDNKISKDGIFDVDIEKGVVSDEFSDELSCDGSGGGVRDCEGLNCNEGLENVVVGRRDGEERGGDGLERKIVREKPKAMSAKKPPKHPRPPKGLSLDLADQKLIRELHELAKIKRARIERMKKKAKEAKVTSSRNYQFATLVTILFCVVFLFQGISSRTNSAANFHGTLASSVLAEDTVISIQQYPTSSANSINGPISESPRSGSASSHDMPDHVSTAAVG